jgi:Rrf2 family transcriptional regulator, iron-sulfur cluster assembly transcription factor
MKLSSQEEYGVRCLIQVAGNRSDGGITIPEISEAEGISTAHAAKLLRILRHGGFVKSARGKIGGYSLSRAADKILLSDVLNTLGGRLFETGFCESHSGQGDQCRHSAECSLRILWRTLQVAVDQVLEKTTLQDLLRTETEMLKWVPTVSAGPRENAGRDQSAA